MLLNDDKEKAAAKAAKQAIKDAKKGLKKQLNQAPSGSLYDTPMKNAAIDYFMQKQGSNK